MNQGDSPSLPRAAIGCDYSTHKVHFASLDHERGVRQARVDLDGLSMAERVEGLQLALESLSPAVSLVLEKPFVHRFEARVADYHTPIELALVAGMVVALAAQLGVVPHLLTPQEWRSQAGVLDFSRSDKRDDLKAAARALVKLEYDLKLGPDAAEALLMAGVARGLARWDLEASLRPVRRAK